jgi:uncharacterized damage-inducible protein DinB
MQIKQHLIDMFKYNDYANRKILEKIRRLPDPTEAVRVFSHVVNTMNMWMAQIEQYPKYANVDGREPVYPLDKLEAEWDKALRAWLDLLDSKTEDGVLGDVQVVAYDGKSYPIALRDIVLQLNYHAVHHRANIQALIRAQGLEPDFLDYIGMVYKWA